MRKPRLVSVSNSPGAEKMKKQVARVRTSRYVLSLRSLICTTLLYAWSYELAAQDNTTANASCCSSISEFQFHPLPLGQEVEFSLTTEGPTYAFGEHRQRFIALKMPDGFIGTTIQVKMFLSTAFLPRASVVIPEFIYLGADLRIVERQTTKGFQEAGGFFRTALLGRAEVPPDARYIVVIAGDGDGGRPIYNVGGGRAFGISPATEGDFTLRLFGESVTR